MNSRETREDDMEYMKQIILIGDDDSQYEKLTPIELVIYNFLSEYFDINEDGSVEFPKQKLINRVYLSKFYMQSKRKGVTEKDFLSVLFLNAPENGTGCLNLKQRMFDSWKISEWNDLNGFSSIISPPDRGILGNDKKTS